MEFQLAGERHFGVEIGFLALDAPVFQLVERDGLPRHRATHERARHDHLEISVQVAEASLARARSFETAHCGPLTPFRHTCPAASSDPLAAGSAPPGPPLAASDPDTDRGWPALLSRPPSGRCVPP